MSIPAAFFLCLTFCIVGIVVAFINIATAPKRAFGSGNVTSIFAIHVMAALCYVLGGLGTIGFGIAWIVTYLKG